MQVFDASSMIYAWTTIHLPNFQDSGTGLAAKFKPGAS